MLKIKQLQFLFIPTLLTVLLCSCNQDFKSDDYTAYFGGEVINPTSPYVLFYKDSKIIDSIKIDENNRFFKKFDSLTPGMYTFRNEPQYQYVFFDKNDSLMVHIDGKNFDDSVVFCGRGDEKNNFLMELYLKNENDKKNIFEIFDYDVTKFNKNIDSAFVSAENFYNSKKEKIKWNEEFDIYAKAALNFHYYSKKELYPLVHNMRTGENIYDELPKNYYSYRKEIDFNNKNLTDYSPFVVYLSYLLNNMGSINFHNHYSDSELVLKTNINKLNITDSLIKDEKVKNYILDNIAFTYFIEDQNIANNKTFLENYKKYSSNKRNDNEILKIGKTIQLLKSGNPLPEIKLIDRHGTEISSDTFSNSKTVIFFWTKNATAHFLEAHKRAKQLKLKYPDYNFIGINLDNDQSNWLLELNKVNYDGITELRSANFEEIKTKWAIMKVYRTIVLNNNGTINNAFTDLFNVDFKENLESRPFKE